MSSAALGANSVVMPARKSCVRTTSTTRINTMSTRSMTKSRRSAATGMTIESFIARSLRDGASYLNSMMRMQPAEPAPPAVAVDDVDPEPEPPAPQPPPAAPAVCPCERIWPPPANSLLPPLPGFTSVPEKRTPGSPAAPATVSLQPELQVAAAPPGPPRLELTVVPATSGPRPPEPKFATHCPEALPNHVAVPAPPLVPEPPAPPAPIWIV